MFFNSPTHTIQEAAQLQRQQLRANVATFDAALLALKNGNDQILPPIAAAQQVGNSYIYIYTWRSIRTRKKYPPPLFVLLFTQTTRNQVKVPNSYRNFQLVNFCQNVYFSAAIWLNMP